MRSRRDLVCRRRLQLLDRLGGNRRWLRELSQYYRGLTIQEFWVRYTLGRMEAAKLWERKPRSTEGDYRSFYAETDYFVLRTPGGENLVESAAQRADTIGYLNRALEAVVPLQIQTAHEVDARYVKPRR